MKRPLVVVGSGIKKGNTDKQADDLFRTFEHAVSYYRFNGVNYLGWKDKGMVVAGGCGGFPTERLIDKTDHLQAAYQFGKCIQ